MTPASEYLLGMGKDVLARYAALPGAVCAAITGSAAEGHADEHSDLDSTVYYRELPTDEELAGVRRSVGAGEVIWRIGSHAEGEFAEAFRLNGVEVQIGHTTVARWEEDMRRVLTAEDVASPLHKAMSGTLVSLAVKGEDVLEGWKRELRAFPDVLARAMVKHYLKFFAVWGVIDRLERRDGQLWLRQTLADSSFNILGTLAGINRQYFTSFQFKRAGAFIRTLKMAPPRLAERLDSIWGVDVRSAAAVLKVLVAETVEIVEREMPGADTVGARKALARDDRAWTMR